MDELTKLAIKYGTDKWGKHHYTPVYYDLFKDRRNEVKKVLEIGPAEGAGLFMFRDFFPNATIYGMEIDLKRVEKLQNLDRIKVYQGNQALSGDLNKIAEWINISELDIIIDDGSHKTYDQVFSCSYLYPQMKKGATYIIEDVADADIYQEIASTAHAMLVRLSKRYDDQIIVCQK